MKETMILPRFIRKVSALFALVLLAVGVAAYAQNAGRILGTIVAIGGNTITVKTDAGASQQVTVAPDASIKRLEPGQTLASAAAIGLADLAVNDRVLIKLDPASPTPQAVTIVAMKHSDVAEKQQKDREAWQNGVAGLVKKVDPATGAILVTTGAGPTSKLVTVNTAKSTVLLRYAPDSIRFADAKAAPLDAIQPGDQLRARGTKTPDGSQIAADEIVSGTFRNIAGTVVEVDAAASKLVVKDLATKKPVTIQVTPDVQLRRIPERMAQFLALRLKGAMNASGAQARMGNGAPQANGRPNAAAGSGGARWPGAQGGAAGGMGGDPQQFLSRAPAIKLADLEKGEAVMVVTTSGANDVKAITLLAGVEPLLEAPAATDLLSNWSMGGGGADAAAGTE